MRLKGKKEKNTFSCVCARLVGAPSLTPAWLIFIAQREPLIIIFPVSLDAGVVVPGITCRMFFQFGIGRSRWKENEERV